MYINHFNYIRTMFVYLAMCWCVIFVSIGCLCLPIYTDEDRMLYKLTVVMTIVSVMFISHITYDVWALYEVPHLPVTNVSAFSNAEILLDCARHYIPRLRKEWISIEHCLDEVNIYFTNGKFRKKIPQLTTAFVFTNVDKSSIFVTPIYDSLSKTEKALVLIHECAHLALGAEDYAYRWQPEFMHLTKEQHYRNADSYFDAVFYHCTL